VFVESGNSVSESCCLFCARFGFWSRFGFCAFEIGGGSGTVSEAM